MDSTETGCPITLRNDHLVPRGYVVIPVLQRVGAAPAAPLYNFRASIGAVLDYLDKVDPEAAAVARERYRCAY
jgi:hypothetical protein